MASFKGHFSTSAKCALGRLDYIESLGVCVHIIRRTSRSIGVKLDVLACLQTFVRFDISSGYVIGLDPSL